MPAHAAIGTPHENSSQSISRLNSEPEAILPDDAYILAFDYINHRLKQRSLPWPDCPELPADPTPAMRAMRKLGDLFEAEYIQELSVLSSNLVVSPSTAYADFMDAANGLFETEASAGQMKISWGRIVSLFSWAGILAARCYQTGRKPLVMNVTQFLAIFVESKLIGWIESNGGWVSVSEGWLTSCVDT